LKIFLNPGHCVESNLDPGAVNSVHSVTEAEVVLAIGYKVKEYLERAGVEVELLQSNNLCGEYPVMPCITDSVNASDANIALSLHCNAYNRIARGTEAWIYKSGGDSYHLANRLLTQLTTKFPKLIDRGVKESRSLAFLRCTGIPAVLLEIAFIDNEDDVQLLICQQDEIARCIARGITDYGRDFY
jgi:N-acetylmuramoyl-L-alanine amidase